MKGPDKQPIARRTNRLALEACRLSLLVLPIWTIGLLLRVWELGRWELDVASSLVLVLSLLGLGFSIGYLHARRTYVRCRDGRPYAAKIPYFGLFLFLTAIPATTMVRIGNIILSVLVPSVPLLYTPYFLSWSFTWGLPMGIIAFERANRVTLWVSTSRERIGLLSSVHSEYSARGPSPATTR